MAAHPKYNAGLTAFYGVTDLKASVDWYRKVLGFELEYHIEDAGWAELRSPVGNVYVGLSEVEKAEPKGGATLTWGVVDIEAARAAVEAHGVSFDGPIRQFGDMVKLTTFFDPDGHKVMFSQSLK